MKILEIMPEFGLAGAERMVEALSLSLMKKGEDVHIISLYDYHSDITKNLESKKIQITYLDKRIGLDLRIIGKLAKVIKEYSPNIIHTHRYVLPYTYLAMKLTRKNIPIVHTIHNQAEKEDIKLYRRIKKILFKLTNITPIALTNAIKQSIIDEYGKIKAREIPVIFNGINLDNIVNKKKDYNTTDNFRICHVGRFSNAKNHISIIDAFDRFHNRHPQSEIFFFGEGELFESVQTHASTKKSTNSIHFMGTSNNVINQLSEYDLFILPSIFEGMPMTIIEAMAVGMPILSSKVGGIPDIIVHDKNGVLINPSTENIYNAIERLYKDKNLRSKIGQQALIDSIQYSSDNMAKSYLKIFQSLV